MLTRAADLQDALVRATPSMVALREEAVNLAILRASDARMPRQFANALAMLVPASAWLADGQGLSRGVVIKVRTLLANLAACTGDTATAVAQAESGVATPPRVDADGTGLAAAGRSRERSAERVVQRAGRSDFAHAAGYPPARLGRPVAACGSIRFPEDALGVHRSSTVRVASAKNC